MPNFKKISLLLGLGGALLLAGCGNGAQNGGNSTPAQSDAKPSQSVAAAKQVALDVYKSETCGCCEDWIHHMQDQDFAVTSHHPLDLAAEKQELGVAPRYQSCHTAVSADGYLFEGHIPAKLVTRFLNEKPEGAIGLAVPGMPVGSPGMEMDDRFTPYDVLLLKEDGSSQVYARMETAQAQY